MVNINLDPENYRFTTKNVLENFKVDEEIVPIKNSTLKFYFRDGHSYLLVDDKEYQFESTGSLIAFLQKLSINSTLISSLTDETLAVVANERLQNFSSTVNLIVDKNTGQIITITSMASNLVSWRRVLKTVHDFFSIIGEKELFLTTFTGLGISIKMNSGDNSDLDVIRIEPQTPSAIPVYRGLAVENVPTKGYDEDEILQNLVIKLEYLFQIDPNVQRNYSIVS